MVCKIKILWLQAALSTVCILCPLAKVFGTVSFAIKTSDSVLT